MKNVSLFSFFFKNSDISIKSSSGQAIKVAMSRLVLLNLQNNVAAESAQRPGGGAERPIAPTERPLADKTAINRHYLLNFAAGVIEPAHRMTARHALANIRFAAVLSSGFAGLLAFAKCRRLMIVSPAVQ